MHGIQGYTEFEPCVPERGPSNGCPCIPIPRGVKRKDEDIQWFFCYVFFLQDLTAGLLPVIPPDREDDFNLGDVILGMPVISEECEGEGVRLEHRLPVVVTHGLCHLLGYQHDTALHAENVRTPVWLGQARQTVIIFSDVQKGGSCLDGL